jgi:putative phosphoesterase
VRIEDSMPDPIKIVVMSDTHVEAATEEFRFLCSRYCEDAAMVIHLGDWERVGVLNYLERYPLEAVSGNMDDYAIKQRLPAQKVVKVGRFRLGLSHGWGPPQGIRKRVSGQFDQVDAILFGHTHEPMIARESGLFWFNPGSVFHGRGSCPASIGLLKIQDRIEGEIIELDGFSGHHI